MTPNFATIHFDNPYWRRFSLWLPLFVLWIPVVLLSPLWLLVLLVACLASGIPFWKSLQVFWQILCSLQGTEVQVRAQQNDIRIRLV